MKALAFHTALAFLLPPAFTSFKGSPVFPQYDCKRDDVGGAFSLPPPLFAAPEIVRRVASGFPAISVEQHLVLLYMTLLLPSRWSLGSLAGIAGKVCRGLRSPKGYARFL